MNLYKMIEICLKYDNMHIFVMINALICINNYVITCINSMLSTVAIVRRFTNRRCRLMTVRSSINDRDAFDEEVLQFDHPLDFDLAVKIDLKFICVD